MAHGSCIAVYVLFLPWKVIQQMEYKWLFKDQGWDSYTMICLESW